MSSRLMATRPLRPSTMRTTSKRVSEAGMKSVSRTRPSAVSNSVSRISVPSRYLRRTAVVLPLGPMRQLPCSGARSNAAKQAPESNRGKHSPSIEPSDPTSAAVWQSPMSAYSSIGSGIQRSQCRYVRAARVRECAGKLGTQEKNLRRIVHPHEQHDERAGGAVSAAERASAEIKSDQRFADREQKRRDRRADPDVAPGNGLARYVFV